MPIKSVKLKIWKHKRNAFLSHVPRITPKIRFLGQKVCSIARMYTDMKVNTGKTLSRVREFFLQPIIKVRSDMSHESHLLLHLMISPTIKGVISQ